LFHLILEQKRITYIVSIVFFKCQIDLHNFSVAVENKVMSR